MMQSAVEFNFDGLVGPTHNYAGLAFGNIASTQNAGIVSNPKQAAKQGLLKMRMLYELGVPQAVLPPQQRPNLDLLRALGFSGNNKHILQQAYKKQPELFAACYSAASMWAANMATISPSCDTADSRVHITPANLSYNLHRAQEAKFSYKLLQKIFNDSSQFMVHPPLLACKDLTDEGAANHSVLCKEYGKIGLELFVYGGKAQKFPARQSKLASSANIRNHLLNDTNCLLLEQNPVAIDAGVFHNDVIFVSNKNVLLYHAEAFVDWHIVRNKIAKYFADDCYFLELNAAQLSLDEAVRTYLFNSQLVSLADGDMVLIAPEECRQSATVQAIIDDLIAQNNPLKSVRYLDLLQSMRNGGGPACLRLRAVLTEQQQKLIHPKIIFNQDLYSVLDAWVDKHYRDRLTMQDLADDMLVEELFTALDELTKILDLGSIYPFQLL